MPSEAAATRAGERTIPSEVGQLAMEMGSAGVDAGEEAVQCLCCIGWRQLRWKDENCSAIGGPRHEVKNAGQGSFRERVVLPILHYADNLVPVVLSGHEVLADSN